MKAIYKINPKDNVVVALQDLKKGENIPADGKTITLNANIAAGHKIAIANIPEGECIVKYGFPIGTAACNIAAGDWVHTHNTKTRLGDLLDYSYEPSFKPLEPQTPRTFLGYKRKDGKVGIRNEVWIIPTVGCVNSIAKLIEEESQKFLTPELDGIYSYSHPYGCSQLSQDKRNTELALSGLIHHPNAGAVLVLGLGCENSNIDELKKVLGDYDSDRVKFLVCQEHEDEVEDAVKIVEELCRYASQFKREPCSVEHLTIGLKCGGSDGFSGITANPLVGALPDLLIAQGGTAILTEVPEMFGAETILMNRCRSKEVFDKTVDLINNFKKYFMRYNEKIDSNPSPGNKAGGITTLEDKSLGCVQKGGTAPVNDVLRYGQSVHENGLNLLQAPGNDLVASTALAVSGAHMVLFTTGRGTPFGCPVPTVKISSNSELARKKARWIDFDAGKLLTGTELSELAQELLDYVINVASGKQTTKSEAFDKRELAIFKDGVTL
ncbi:UxaA family hydrolase [Thermocaproicibacter melissae]|uniref:UxaA family hydrolase n=1 Tax=Thermocaproicibacter melissae TaxID=2966552 RepID=UPI0024B1D0C0|nr:altronate dehydratase family protein [Thermocaproicibacter melissae]WBY63977.1 altronate dehydratase family protein [Thermocaproicibacter melissae]